MVMYAYEEQYQFIHQVLSETRNYEKVSLALPDDSLKIYLSGSQLDIDNRFILYAMLECGLQMTHDEYPEEWNAITNQNTTFSDLKLKKKIEIGGALTPAYHIDDRTLSTSFTRIASITLEILEKPDWWYITPLLIDIEYDKTEKEFFGTVNQTILWLYWRYFRQIIEQHLGDRYEEKFRR